ncbi:hypothetical protein AB0K51_27090 [Kitasatospora sp. NPDC049285]|uniref:hypothetical protein n=1 Tax=Kitasatospora sp. NPDC049285 TaxID=3157096 RepID=UPI0034466EB8
MRTYYAPAYYYGEQSYCADCIRELFTPNDIDLFGTQWPSAEQCLDHEAKRLDINRLDENSFSTYRFPKVMPEWERTDNERCYRCQARL